jgi:hypothetical protein
MERVRGPHTRMHGARALQERAPLASVLCRPRTAPARRSRCFGRLYPHGRRVAARAEAAHVVSCVSGEVCAASAQDVHKNGCVRSRRNARKRRPRASQRAVPHRTRGALCKPSFGARLRHHRGVTRRNTTRPTPQQRLQHAPAHAQHRGVGCCTRSSRVAAARLVLRSNSRRERHCARKETPSAAPGCTLSCGAHATAACKLASASQRAASTRPGGGDV